MKNLTPIFHFSGSVSHVGHPQQIFYAIILKVMDEKISTFQIIWTSGEKVPFTNLSFIAKSNTLCLYVCLILSNFWPTSSNFGRNCRTLLANNLGGLYYIHNNGFGNKKRWNVVHYIIAVGLYLYECYVYINKQC